jgi:hypothetical protein
MFVHGFSFILLRILLPILHVQLAIPEEKAAVGKSKINEDITRSALAG